MPRRAVLAITKPKHGSGRPKGSRAPEPLPVVSVAPRLMTTAQAARYLAVSAAFLAADRLNQRRVPYVKIGAAVRYELASLDFYIAACRQVAA